MDIIYIIITSLGSIIVLFILTKIMGSREIAQLSMFDFVNGITIGSIAAEMATSLEDDYMKPLVAMIVYAIVVTFISYATCKSIKLRRFITGTTLILFKDGKLYKKNLLKAKLDIGEFLALCRTSGYFNLDDIYTAILEPSGKISFLPKSTKRFVTPEDLNLNPEQETLIANVVIDGHIMEKNLKSTGNNEKWLEKQIHAQGVSDISDIFLATCDQNDKLSIYVKLKESMKHDIFE